METVKQNVGFICGCAYEIEMERYGREDKPWTFRNIQQGKDCGYNILGHILHSIKVL